MNIYERFGVRPIINVAGTKTRYGAALMEEEALKAMNEAANYSVNLFDLEAAASKIIAQKTHAEAGLVTCGAFASLTLAAAACMCGLNVNKMNSLPDTTNFPHEFIMPWHQISGYDHSIKVAGGKIIPVGIQPDTPHPNEVTKITVRDVEAEVNEDTVGIVYAARYGSHPPLQEVIKLAKRYQVPVIVDAAAQIPPVENLHRFIDYGADLICFSGGKGIRGPQASGILCGRKELICSAVMQMLDMAIRPFDEWEPPAEFKLLKEKLRGRPAHGIGRGAKVSKEAIIGLLVALENLDSDKFKQKAEYLKSLLNKISTLIKDLEGVEIQMSEEYKNAYPMLMVKIDEKKLGKSANDVVKELEDSNIFPRDNYKDSGFFYIHSLNMNDKISKIVGEKLFHILKKN